MAKHYVMEDRLRPQGIQMAQSKQDPWEDIKDYLKGNIDLQVLKQRLGC